MKPLRLAVAALVLGPALHLVDRDGRVVYRHVGEGNYEETEQRVRQLLGDV